MGSQKPIADAFPANMTVEFGVGYTGVFSKYRVFESYAHMHYVYGLLKDDSGHFFDAVIPNYFEPERFPFKEEKEDYFWPTPGPKGPKSYQGGGAGCAQNRGKCHLRGWYKA
jgi:hypothetical protein